MKITGVYRQFGDKASLFLQAVRRYGQTEGSKPLIAFQQETDISAAILAFFKAAVLAATTEGRPTGCLVACVACAYADRSEDVRAFFAASLRQLPKTLEARLEAEIRDGHLPSSISAQTRAHMMVDIVQGIAIRARAGIKRDELLADVDGCNCRVVATFLALNIHNDRRLIPARNPSNLASKTQSAWSRGSARLTGLISVNSGPGQSPSIHQAVRDGEAFCEER